METPLHFDGGLFSDIRSTEGKLLSKVTVDRVQNSTQHDITDSPSAVCIQDNQNYVDAIMKTETITNKDVITVKFTPVPPELESPWLLTPSQFVQLQSQSPVEYFKGNYEAMSTDGDVIQTETITNKGINAVKFTPVPPELDSPRLLTPSQFIKLQSQSPVEYIKDNYEDLQSYKIVNSLCREKILETDFLTSDQNITEKIVKFNITNGNEDSFFHKDIAEFVENDDLKGFKRLHVADELCIRGHSPLENTLVSEQLIKLDNYLQESLDVCLGRKGTPIKMLTEIKDDTKLIMKHEVVEKSNYFEKSVQMLNESDTKMENISYHKEEQISKTPERVEAEPMQREVANQVEFNAKKVSKLISVPKQKAGILYTIYNMPVHYHAVIVCVILIIYNLIYQYMKQNSQGNKR